MDFLIKKFFLTIKWNVLMIKWKIFELILKEKTIKKKATFCVGVGKKQSRNAMKLV